MPAPSSDPDPKNDPKDDFARAVAAPAGPADDLGAVWRLLDALPPAAAGGDLAATTVDLVAAKVAGATRTRDRERIGPGRWITPVAAVVASLAVGLVAGRVAAPDPDQWVLERLPVIEHLGLLREAGSIEFLEAVAERMSVNPELPRWPRAGDPQSLREEAREFDAVLGKLEVGAADRGQGRDAMRARRASVAALPAARKADLERNVETFRRLSSLDRGQLTAVAAALADPTNRRLRDAARRWHLFLAAMNPVVRRTVIEMPADERLEMLERPAGRPRDEFRERRPNGEGGGLPRRPPNGPPRPIRPGLPPPRNDPPQEPRPGSARDQGLRFPPPPGTGPREAPAETRAPPR
jgi:hypothetical protein